MLPNKEGHLHEKPRTTARESTLLTATWEKLAQQRRPRTAQTNKYNYQKNMRERERERKQVIVTDSQETKQVIKADSQMVQILELVEKGL